MTRGLSRLPCRISGCGNPAQCRDLCQMHDGRLRRNGDPLKRVRADNSGKLCAADGCDRASKKRGYCNKHYLRWWKTGDALTPLKLAPDGSGSLKDNGYREVGGKYEHILVAERALGKPLPAGAEVHHVNGSRADNRGTNLVICPSHAYHMLLHVRTKAYDACGHADWARCQYCRKYDARVNLLGVTTRPSVAYHRECVRDAERQRRGGRSKKPSWAKAGG